jgi:hypothetical protein
MKNAVVDLPGGDSEAEKLRQAKLVHFTIWGTQLTIYTYWYKRLFVKVLLFIVHCGFSIFLMHWFVKENKCDNVSYRATYYQSPHVDKSNTRPIFPVIVAESDAAYKYNIELDAVCWNTDLQCGIPGLHAVHSLNGEPLIDWTSPLCQFRGVLPSAELMYLKDDYTLGGVNNMIFLMVVFEWITASFALTYVAAKLDAGYIQTTCDAISLVWNLCLFVFSLAYSPKLPWNNMTIGWLLAAIAMAWQAVHIYSYKAQKVAYKLNTITTRYFEYAITAPVLLIAVQGTVTQAKGWTFPVAFACMAVTNLLGIPLQKAVSYELSRKKLKESEKDDDKVKASDTNQVLIFMTLLVSWLSFLTSFVVYLIETGALFDLYPIPIQVLVVVLPLLFVSFGLCATFICIQVMMGKPVWSDSYMDYVYDILSLVVKVFVVLTIWFSAEFRPNSGCDV